MKKILTIDDNPDNLISLNAILKDLLSEIEVVPALSGPKGIELAVSIQPDIILLDILMPVMDGFEVCKKLKADPLLADIPIVFVTSTSDSKEIRLKAIEAGAEAFLTKPIDETELTVQLQAMFKIRSANLFRKDEQSRLEMLVQARTDALERELEEKKRVVGELGESEDRFRTFFETSNIGKSITSPEGKIFVNQAFCRMLGYEREELGNKRWQDLTPAEEVEEVQGKLSQLLSGEKEAVRFEKRYIHKDTSHVWADVSVAIKRDKDGKPQYFITTIVDISDRKKAEMRLIEKEINARAIMESTDDVLILLNKEGILLDCNEAHAKKIGIPRNELIGRNVFAFLPKEIAEKRKRMIQEALSSQKPVSFEDTRDGSWNEITINPISHDGQATDRVAIFSRNITGRKRDEEEIKENEAIFSQFMEHSPVYVFFKDDQIRSLRLSRNFEKMLGKNLDELIGKTMDELFPSDLAKKMIMDDRQILEKGEKIEVDEMLNGRFYTTIKFPIQVDGEHRFLAGYTIDITERKVAEEALRKSEVRLIELNATKDKFFSIISHDLKSPFNSLLGFSNLLVEQIELKDYEGINEYANIIQLSSRRVMDLLENLLQWSRLQIGRIEFSPEYFEFGQVIREVTDLLNGAALQKSITISSDLPVKVFAYADKSMVSSIMRNLISNAIKFTRPGGKIVLKAKQSRDELLVSVEDNGIGIRKDVIPRLFKIEESFSTAGTLKEHGTGLGLILCKDFVEKHGGKIWVESDSDSLQHRGSTFRFTIPMQSGI